MQMIIIKITTNQSRIMNVFVLYENFVQMLVKYVGLVRTHSPTSRQLTLFLFQLVPTCFFDVELSCNFVPILLPVNPCIENKNNYSINSGIVSDKPKPTVCHRPELIFILDQSIVVQLIFIKRALLIGGYRIVRTQFLKGYYRLLYLLHINIPFNVSFERIQEKAVRALIYFGYLYVFGFLNCLPMLSVFDIQFGRYETYSIDFSFCQFWIIEVFLPRFIIDESQCLSCIIKHLDFSTFMIDQKFSIVENDSWGSEQFALF